MGASIWRFLSAPPNTRGFVKVPEQAVEYVLAAETRPEEGQGPSSNVAPKNDYEGLMPGLPTGTVTFLFTDIAGSTELIQRLGDRRYAEVLEEHHRLIRDAFADEHGQEVDRQGDSFLVVFSRARDAVGAAVAAQRALTNHTWPDGASLRVRMGLHTGEPVSETKGYVGLDVHRAARICAAGHGGQILLSQAVVVLAAHDLPPEVSLRDLGAHRLKNLREPEHLFQVVHPDLPSDFPAFKSLDACPNNLPRQLTSFIGREKEIAEVKRLLSTAYLVTLTGIGGAGKTRLALQVAADLLDTYSDGVWLVELAALSDPALIPNTVASALNVHEQPGRPLIETLVDSLRSKSLLVVLDNCEHVLPACAELAAGLLRFCPALRILATSREPLGIPGEASCPVPSLSLPDPRWLPVEHVTRCEAVRLFVERAVSIHPGFTVAENNAAAVVQICNRLDGIPLAIELAAARVKVLTVEQIAARLDDRFRLLTGGGPTVLPRHQTLRAAMDWSYDLLSEGERTVLRRLSVFAGGCMLEAAEAVCTGGEVEVADLLDVMTHLVDKSLVSVETQDKEARYHLLETVRQYAHDRLMASTELADARRRHRDWYLGMAERTNQKLRGPEQEASLERLEAEHENLRAALAWSKTDKDGGKAWLRLASALAWFWFINEHWSEGRLWLEDALSAGNAVESTDFLRVVGWAGGLAYQQGDIERARELTDQAWALSERAGDTESSIRLRAIMGNLAVESGELDRAIALLEESVTLAREFGDKWHRAFTLTQLADGVRAQGDYERAARLYSESIGLFREVGDNWRIAIATRAMGILSLRQRDYGRAAAFHAESLRVREPAKNRWISYQNLEGLACVACALGHYEKAAMLFGAAEPLHVSLRSRRDPDYQAELDRYVDHTRTSLGEGAFAAAWAEGRAMTLEQAIEYALQHTSDESRIRSHGNVWRRCGGMEVIDLKGGQRFSSTHHIQISLAESPLCGIGIACWEPGQISPIHCHPKADEIYHVLEGVGLFRDGRSERRLEAGGTVFFRVGEIHQVQGLTRMVLFRVQAGPDRRHEVFAAWPAM